MSGRRFQHQFYRALLLVVLLLVFLLLTRFMLERRLDVTFANFVATTMTSVLLLLAYLYLAGIQEDQLDIMEAAYTPVLVVNNVEIMDRDPSNTLNGEGDWIKLDLSNVGNEVAKDISVKVILKTVPSVSSFAFQPTANGLKRLDMEVEASQSEGGVLAPNKSEKPFAASIKTHYKNNDESTDVPIFFTNVVSAIPKSVETIQFALVIEFTNSAGKEYQVPIRPARRIERPTESISFQEAWNQAEVMPIRQAIEISEETVDL